MKYILLKPVLALIQEQELREQQLNYNIVELKNTLAANEAGKKQLWQESLQKLLQGKPAVEKSIKHVEPHMPVLPQILLSEHEEKALVDLITKRCMSHVMHEKST